MKKLNSKKGFTMVEVLVSVGIFSIILGSALMVFSNTLRNQRKINYQQTVLGEMSYVMEYISRSLRMAKKDDVDIYGISTKNCFPAIKANYQATTSGVIFRSYGNACQEFYLENNQLKEIKDSGQPAVALTSPNIRITHFEIANSGSWGQSDNLQAAITISVEVTNPDNTKDYFHTTVSQRDLDVAY
jgi:prepilin-type N-terminal cleavage/methylation domain-containing protein